MSVARQKLLRRSATPAEQAMWRLLKPFRDKGFHFRRQVALGRYYADFACHHAKVVIEVDGDTHATGRGPEHDAERDGYLRERGFSVLRMANRDVMNNPEGVFHLIEQALAEKVATPTPNPSPQGGGEQAGVPHD